MVFLNSFDFAKKSGIFGQFMRFSEEIFQGVDNIRRVVKIESAHNKLIV